MCVCDLGRPLQILAYAHNPRSGASEDVGKWKTAPAGGTLSIMPVNPLPIPSKCPASGVVVVVVEGVSHCAGQQKKREIKTGPSNEEAKSQGLKMQTAKGVIGSK